MKWVPVFLLLIKHGVLCTNERRASIETAGDTKITAGCQNGLWERFRGVGVLVISGLNSKKEVSACMCVFLEALRMRPS